MGQTQKVTYIDRHPVDILLLYKKIVGEDLEKVAEDEWLGKCVLHDDAKPSCHYTPSKGVFHCKVCDKGGNAWTFVMATHTELDKAGATKWLVENKFIQDKNPASNWEHVDVTYDYVDENGALLLQVGRWNNPKAFGQRLPDGKGGWKYSLKDLKRRVPFLLPDLMKAISRGEDIYVVEGEKDVLNLTSLGVCATTNPQGAKWKWPVEWADFFAGAKRVIVIADNDKPGLEGAHQRAGVIARNAESCYVIEQLPGVGEKGDVSDWLQLPGSGIDALEALAATAVKVQPYIPPYPVSAVDELVDDLSDTGNGGWFKDCVGADYRYILDYGKWVTYTGKVWEGPINEMMVTEQVVNLMRQASKDYAGDLKEEFDEHIQKSRSVRARKSMLESAQGPLGMRSKLFDSHQTLLNVNNGTLDLMTASLNTHTREDYLTLLSPVDFDDKADCPSFKKWLMDACNGSQELFDYMQQVMGSCLEGKSGSRRFYFIFGPKGTGKSTFIRTLEKLLGPYQCATDFKALTESKFSDGNGPSPALARLKGMRMVTASESRDSDKLDVARIKQLIGGDSITARHLNQGMEEFRFEATLILSGNEMPRINGDESVWDKFKPVPFTHQIDGEDPNFEKKYIDPELPGILRFALEGLIKLRANDYKLADPVEVAEAREQERDIQDPFAEWFMEQMEKTGTDKVPCDVVYNNYNAWCAKNKCYAFKRQKLTRWLKDKQGVEVQQSNVHKFYVGIRPKFNPDGGGGSGGEEPGF
jgi:putative DNA primase/helicase